MRAFVVGLPVALAAAACSGHVLGGDQGPHDGVGTGADASALGGGGPDAGAATGPPDAAPEEPDYPTPEPALRFDLSTFDCPASGVCDPASDSCFCQDEFEHINYTSQSHFLAVGTEAHRPAIRTVGNYQAFYVNDLNVMPDGRGWRDATAIERADAMVARCEELFPTVCPKWFLLNEISYSQWGSQSAYRAWVVGVARRLTGVHHKAPIVFAPFAAPQRYDADWRALGQAAYIGVENFLSGAEIAAAGFSQSWCQSQYAASISAYGARGVPLTRLFLTEHFGNNTSDKAWGRGGVSDADWRRAIQVRTPAAHALGFPGFVSYCWGCNSLHETSEARIEYEDLYGSMTLP